MKTAIRATKRHYSFIFIAFLQFAGTAHGDSEVCVSYRGNGPKFPSLLGQAAALLQQGYKPRVSVGGSSGANVAALVQSLVENNSLAGSQHAAAHSAFVLRASRQLLDSFVFLPSFDRPAGFIRALLTYLREQLEQDRVAGRPELSIAHSDHTLAQTLLFIDFYQNQDFSDALTASSESTAAAQLLEIFASATHALRVSPEEFMHALLPSDDSHHMQAQGKKIRAYLSGYLSLGNSQNRLSADDATPAKEFVPWMKRLTPQQRAWVRKTVWNVLRNSAFFPGPEMSQEKTLLLPSPIALQKALSLHSSFSSNTIEIPNGFVAHTTAFPRGSLRVENLRQFYFSGGLARTELRGQWEAEGGRLPLLSVRENDELRHVLAPDKIWIASGHHTISEVLRSTTAEPLLFERRDISLTEADLKELNSDADTRWVANGGWLDTASYPLLQTLNACKNLPIVLITPRDGINSFQMQALRGLLNLPKARRGEPDALRESGFYLNLERYLRTHVQNDNDRIILDFDWDTALKSRPRGQTSLRQFLFDAAYQHATSTLGQ
ncbi:MAG: hypothetical protein RLZZ488_415 [Pseudomonadota bacterium]